MADEPAFKKPKLDRVESAVKMNDLPGLPFELILTQTNRQTIPVLNQAADRKPIVCPICQKSFTTLYSKKAHMLVVHENAGPFKCGHCDKTFRDKSNLKSHENSHTGEKPFKCKKCSKRFNTKGHLKVHKLDNHAEKKFICKQCNKGFGREEGLKLHLVVHSTEKPFQCDKCQKRFAAERHLKSHQIHLHQERKFKCETCGKDFATNSDLKTHLVTHSGEKPFKCKDCSKRFTVKKVLEQHELDIHAEKKFKCAQCDSTFGSKGRLNQHLVTHSEEKPFQCDKCRTRFVRKYHLKRHLLCHMAKEFKCDPCGMSFATKGNLKRHFQRRKHREDREEVGEQPNESNGSGARSNPTNRRAGPDLEKSDESESDTESGAEEAVQPKRHSERRTTKTKNFLPEDEQGSELDDRMESSLKRIKREPEDAEGSRSSDESGNEDSDESEESDEETDLEGGEEEEHCGQRRIKRELSLHEDNGLDDPMEGYSKRIRRESDWDDQTEEAEPDYYDFNELGGINQRRIKRENEMITLSSDESDREGELPNGSNTMASANLKLVFDEEYRAPE